MEGLVTEVEAVSEFGGVCFHATVSSVQQEQGEEGMTTMPEVDN